MTEPIQETRKTRATRWWDDPRAVLAVIALLGALTLQGTIMIADLFLKTSSAAEIRSIPTWAAATVSAVIGFYFGAKGGQGDGQVREVRATVVDRSAPNGEEPE